MIERLFLAVALLREAAQNASTVQPPTAVEVAPAAPTSTVAVPVVVIPQATAGNALYPRPAHDPTLNNGCNEWDVEQAEVDNDGQPCPHVVDNYPTVEPVGVPIEQVVLTADDTTPWECDMGGYRMVTSRWQARRLVELNPALVCGEVTG